MWDYCYKEIFMGSTPRKPVLVGLEWSTTCGLFLFLFFLIQVTSLWDLGSTNQSNQKLVLPEAQDPLLAACTLTVPLSRALPPFFQEGSHLARLRTCVLNPAWDGCIASGWRLPRHSQLKSLPEHILWITVSPLCLPGPKAKHPPRECGEREALCQAPHLRGKLSFTVKCALLCGLYWRCHLSAHEVPFCS